MTRIFNFIVIYVFFQCMKVLEINVNNYIYEVLYICVQFNDIVDLFKVQTFNVYFLCKCRQEFDHSLFVIPFLISFFRSNHHIS